MVAAALVIAACSSAPTAQPPAPVSSSPPASVFSSPPVGTLSTSTHWLIAASAVSRLDEAVGSTVVARYLDGPQTTVIVGRAIPASVADWHVHFALDATSLREIRADVAGGLSPRISMILYDPEHWSFTPVAEQSAVGPSTRTAASLARSAGRELIVAPATDLARVQVAGESAATAFIRSDDLEKVAPSASWVEIQAQGLERNPARYAAYVEQAVRQIRLANPNAVIYAGLSTNPYGPPVDAGELVQDVRLVSSAVSGYWLNVPSPGTACPRCGQPQPQVAIGLLESPAGS